MWLRPKPARFVLWTVVLAVLTVRASDTHLHLCFDGQEAPTRVHFADVSVQHGEAHHGEAHHGAGHHDEGHHGESHADQDFDPLIGLLLKHGGSDPDLALPTCVVAAVLLLPPVTTIVPVDSDSLPADSNPPFYLRPPLRGPPA